MSKRSEFLEDMACHIARELTSAGIDQETANVKALASADAFAKRWQGLHLYVPKNIQKSTQDHHAAIRDAFTGNNHQALAQRYNVHIRTVYKILKRGEKKL